MNLLFVHQNLGDFGGAETFVQLTGSELHARGHTTALLYAERTGRNEAHWRETFGPCFSLRAAAPITMLYEAIELVRPDLIFVNNWEDLDTLDALLSCGIPVARMVHDHSLYCMRGYKYNVFTRHICTRGASPYCVFPCLATVGRNRDGGFPLKWVSYSEKMRELRLNKRCVALLVYSEYQKKELLQNGFQPGRVHLTMPMRMRNPENLRTNYGDRNLVLFAGQIIRGKGVDALLRALAQVRRPFECIILGEGNHRPKCERLSRSLGLAHKVTFKGYVPPSELRQFYLEATVFTVSSLWPEPFGMAGPEAMRYGLPVVAFDAGAIGEWLKDRETGFLVPWNDTSEFASRVETLLGNKDLARELGGRAMRWVQRYDAGHQIDQLEQLFHALRIPALVDEPKLSQTAGSVARAGL